MDTGPSWISIAISLILAAATAGLALATFALAGFTFALAGISWWGVRENKKLIEATKREADLLWENAVPLLIPEAVADLKGTKLGDMSGRLTISYAAGTIPARAVDAWVGSQGRVWVGGMDLLTPTGNNVKIITLGQSRAGSEPPLAWNEWLRREQDGIGYRVVMRWAGPGDHVTERAWWFSYGLWSEIPPSRRG